MEIIDSIISISYTRIGIMLVAFLLFVMWALRFARRFKIKHLRVKQQKNEQKQIQMLRKQFRHDVSTFIESYRNDISAKLEEENAENGLFVFWSGADNVFKKFQSDISYINKLPSKEERVAVRSFYTEAKSLVDGILYNNHLLKKYQYLRCKIKTTTATSAEIEEVNAITQQMSNLGAQLRQQHFELLASLQSAKSYF